MSSKERAWGAGQRNKKKERKKHEIRTHSAQLHAAVSVAGVAAAVAVLTASHAFATENSSVNKTARAPLRMSSAIASAAALVASHCIEIAEEMGADHHQILSVVDSAVGARSNGDIMSGRSSQEAGFFQGKSSTSVSHMSEKMEL